MGTINFATGDKEFVVNDSISVFFNPTDVNFAEQLYQAFDELDKKQEARKNATVSGVEMFEFARNLDKEMREIIDGLFGEGAADALFVDRRGRKMNCYALADGLPIWTNFMFAVMETMEIETADEKKKTSSRLAKYKAKYKV